MKKLTYEKKGWGRATHVGTYNDVMFWQGFVEAGHKCSIHEHEEDHNEIIVVTGKLRINYFTRQLESYNSVVVEAGQSVTISPGVLHQFQVMEDGLIMEVYWREAANRKFDINRHG